MSDRRCCCDNTGCFEVLDNFNRADGTDLGSDWNEAVGNWGISGFQLVEVGTPGAKLFWTTPVPARSGGEMSISIEVYDHYDGAVYYLYPASNSASSEGPVVVKFERVAINDWVVSFIGSGCTDSSIHQAPSYNVFGGLTIGCCVDDDDEVSMMSAGISAQPGYPKLWCDNDDAGGGRYIGIGHGNGASGAVFDNFSARELRTTESPRVKSAECENCWCWCLNNPPDKHLTAEFIDAYFIEEGSPTDCTRANCMTQNWPMDWEYNSGLERWYGEVTVPATAAPQNGLDTDFAFELKCGSSNDDDPSWPGRNFTLTYVAGCTNANTAGAGPYQPIAERSTCVPFSLLFGPFYLRCDDMTCYACWSPRNPANMMLACDETNPAVCGRYYILVTGD